MSIASEITRLQNAKSSLKTAINSKLSSSLITNETIDDYAAKVASIAVPSGEIIQGDLKASVGVGKNLVKEDIYVGTKISKLNGEYCIDISATEIKLIKYEDNTIQVIDTLQETNSGSLINIYEDNDDFYVIYSEAGKIKVIYTDLENIEVFTSNVIGTTYNLLQTDTNKFVSYVKVSNANRIDAQAITIDYNGSSTSITVGETQQMISTSNSYVGAGAYVVGENRIVFYMCDYKASESKCNIQFVLKKVNNNQLEAITSNTLVYTYSTLASPSFSIKQSNPGELDIVITSSLVSSEYGYATITDSGITFTEDSTYSRTNYIYDLSLKQILSNTGGNLYSLSGYTYTLIENISGKPGNGSPRDYAMSKLKTSDNKILMPASYISSSGHSLYIYSNTISSENLIKYYNPSLIGPYISAESGEAGDTIKMYSPSI